MKMTLSDFSVLCVVLCLGMITPQFSKCEQDLLPAPSLVFSKEVIPSSITLFSAVRVLCDVPSRTRLPVQVHLSQVNITKASLLNITITSRSPVIFTLIAKPEFETTFVCWYRNVQTRDQSEFSEPIGIRISALSNPELGLFPPLFPTGAKYTVQCETPQLGYMNTTLKMYERLLPIRPGNESFQFIGSRVLGPGEWGASVTRTNVREAYEYMCEMEVFFNGRALHSRSSPITAMPEELVVRLVPKSSGSGTCYGDAFLKVRDVWRPFCFTSKFDRTSDVAKVVCRELGCGRPIDYDRVRSKGNAITALNCTGNEKKIAECAITSAHTCDQRTLRVICSAALPPPKLALSGRDAAPLVYVRTKESVTIQCVFHSFIDQTAYITFTLDGKKLYTTNTLPGNKVTRTLGDPVPEGKYACYVHTQASDVIRTDNSNVIGIYIYNPPPAGAVAAAVITTISGAMILVFLCMCRTKKEDVQDTEPGSAPNRSTTTPPREAPES